MNNLSKTRRKSTLIDLIHDAEGAVCQILKGDEVEYCRNRAFLMKHHNLNNEVP